MPDKLYFYSGSADVAPGAGANEVVERLTTYSDLCAVPNWRRELSNFAHGWFRWGNGAAAGSAWFPTIEHAFQGAKFELFYPGSLQMFGASEAGAMPPIGLDGLDARKQRKRYVLLPEQLRRWNAAKDRIMHDIRISKYSQNATARAILLMTREAQLWHIRPRQSAIRDTDLESVRAAFALRVL